MTIIDYLKPILIAPLLVLGVTVHAAVDVSKIDLQLHGEKCNERVKTTSVVPAELRIPQGSDERYPAVIILHSNAGVIGVGRFYADALNAVGIATLEIDSYATRNVKNGSSWAAPTACDRLNDAWSGLLYLSEHPKINSKRVGALGLSSGGLVAAFAAQGLVAKGMSFADAVGRSKRGINFKSAAVLYPACVNMVSDPKLEWSRNPNLPRLTRNPMAPMLLIVGTQDDYEDDVQRDCTKVVESYAALGGRAELVLLEGATHAFDGVNPPPPTFMPFAKAGKGATVSMRYSSKDAEKSKALVVDLFTSTLAK
jgi:dienelactone hydrolase